MGIISTHKGRYNWLRKNGYLAKTKASDIEQAYKSDTKAELTNTKFYTSRAYGKLWDKCSKEFQMFRMWVEAHVKK